MKLSELKKGDKGKVISINSKNILLKRRLLDMGITCGVVVSVKKIAPLGDLFVNLMFRVKAISVT